MSVIKPENIQLEYECSRCKAKCVKTDPFEPTYSYRSKTDGSLVGNLCKDCLKIVPENEWVEETIPETAFLIIIGSDGRGISYTHEGIEIDYKRYPTPYDIKAACQEVLDDLNSSKAAVKTMRLLSAVKPPKPNTNLVIPRR